MSENFSHRIDAPQSVIPTGSAAARRSKEILGSKATVGSRLTEGQVNRTNLESLYSEDSLLTGDSSPRQWLHGHSADLIDRLQDWAEDLDAREASLNARTSLLEHRERQFRLWRQEQAANVAETQKRIDRLRGQIEAQARRLAFRDC